VSGFVRKRPAREAVVIGEYGNDISLLTQSTIPLSVHARVHYF
jgi:hypothetical protein